MSNLSPYFLGRYCHHPAGAICRNDALYDLFAYDALHSLPVYSNRISFVHTTVAGLVSALVVAELALTPPGESPGCKR